MYGAAGSGLRFVWWKSETVIRRLLNHVTEAKEWQWADATSQAVTCDRARVIGDYACNGDIDLLITIRSQSNSICTHGANISWVVRSTYHSTYAATRPFILSR
jgi:hypothetical protein